MNLTKITVIGTFGLSTLSGAAAVTLGETAAGFDLFVLRSNPIGDETALLIKETKDKKGTAGGVSRFNGILGVGSNSNTEIESGVIFGDRSEIYTHSTFNEFDNGATMLPGSTIHALGAPTDSVVDTANQEIEDYIAALNLEPGIAQGDMNAPFSYQTAQDFTVLDFDSIAMDGDGIILNGRVGFDDTLVIRIAGDAIFENGAAVTLNNLDRRNVIWLTSDASEFDLHRNETANFEGIVINPTESDQGEHTIIGDVDFKGQVFAASMKLGSGMDFEGTNVPEPSGHLFFFSAFGGLLFRRRR